MTSTLVCDVFLWRDLRGVVSCFKILTNLLIVCSLAAPMDANRDVGDKSEKASIRCIAVLVDAF